MADDKGHAIAGALTVQPKAHGKPNPDAIAPCVACGLPHGSVGVHLHCLGDAVIALRQAPDSRRLRLLRVAVTALRDDTKRKFAELDAMTSRGVVGAELHGRLSVLNAVVALFEAGST
jgi:hypothetical protein